MAEDNTMQTNTFSNTPDTPSARDLDALYIAWHDDQAAAQPAPLTHWLEQHPAFREPLTQWTVAEPLMTYAVQTPADPTAEAHTLAIGSRVLERLKAQAASQTAIADLYAAARAKGMEPKQLAAALGIGLPLMVKLRQRLLQAATLPETLVSRLAEALDVTREQVRAYLNQPPTLAAGALYKADAAPQAAEQEPFTQALAACPGMSEEQKAFWRTQTPPQTEELP